MHRERYHGIVNDELILRREKAMEKGKSIKLLWGWALAPSRGGMRTTGRNKASQKILDLSYLPECA